MSSTKKFAAIAAMVSLAFLNSCSEDSTDENKTGTDVSVIETKVLTDDLFKENDTVSLDASIEYEISGRVYVKDGSVLTIPAGTVLRGRPGELEDASALVVTQGAKLMAQGTASNPIIMTALTDNPLGSLEETARGLWGGLIVLGKAPINRAAGTEYIEGLPTNANGLYGGSDKSDNSGILEYISIRHGGISIAADNEINGLTMGGVGNGTTIRNIAVINNGDDGFEWFGGTVNVSNLYAYGCGDESFDWDEGYMGTMDSLFAMQTADDGDKVIEADGTASDNFGNATPSKPTVKNSIFIGNSRKDLLSMKEETGGMFVNCQFGATDIVNNGAIKIADDKGATLIGTSGNLTFENCKFQHADAASAFAYTPDAGNATTEDAVIAAVNKSGNTFGNAIPSFTLPSWAK